MIKMLLKDTAIYGIADAVFKLMTFLTFPLFAFALTPSEFGLLSLLTTLSAFFGLFVGCGLSQAMQKEYFSKGMAQKENSILIMTGIFCLGINAIFLSLLLAIFLYFFPFLHERQSITAPMVIWSFICGIAMQINMFCLSVVRVEFQPWKYTAINFIQNALLIALPWYFVAGLHFGVLGYAAATALSYLMLVPLSLWMIRHHLCLQFKWLQVKNMVQFGYPFIIAGLGYWLFGSMDRWMLNEWNHPEEVGLYSVAFKIASALVLINFAFGQAWHPLALRTHQSTPSYRQFYSRSLSLWFFVLIALSLSTSLFGYECLMLLTPMAYWPAAKLLPCICMGLAFYGTTPIISMGITLENKTHHYSYAITIAACINFILNWAWIASYGAQGAAVATLISNIVLWLYYLAASQRLHHIPLEKDKLLSCLVLATIGLLFNFWINTFSWHPSLLLYKGTFLLTFFFLGYVLLEPFKITYRAT